MLDYAKPGEENYMIAGYVMYGFMVAAHSLSFWMRCDCYLDAACWNLFDSFWPFLGSFYVEFGQRSQAGDGTDGRCEGWAAG